MTPKPQPKVMTIQPEFWALEWLNRTAETTPSPQKIRIAVPIVSAPMMLKRTPLLERPETGPRRDPSRPYSGRQDQVNGPGLGFAGGAEVPAGGGLPRADGRHRPVPGRCDGAGRQRNGRRDDALLGVEPALDAGHRLVSVLARERADRRAEAHADRLAAERAPGAQA